MDLGRSERSPTSSMNKLASVAIEIPMIDVFRGVDLARRRRTMIQGPELSRDFRRINEIERIKVRRSTFSEVSMSTSSPYSLQPSLRPWPQVSWAMTPGGRMTPSRNSCS